MRVTTFCVEHFCGITRLDLDQITIFGENNTGLLARLRPDVVEHLFAFTTPRAS